MEEFIDPRDNNHYKIVKIGNLYWFAENLKYEGVLHYAPNNDTDNIEKYGYLYDWENAKLACPEGWRLPTKDEFEELLEMTGADNDTSIIRHDSWDNGNNRSEFGALPASNRWSDGDFDNFGSYAYFWSSTLSDNPHRLFVSSIVAYVSNGNSSSAFSVRCVKEVK